MKTCTKCNEMKLDTDFYKQDGHTTSRCAACLKDQRIKSKDGGYDAHIKRTYGLTSEQYVNMLFTQLGVCAICGDLPTRMFCVDHDHTTGRVRGLLCGLCNRGLGMLKDRQDVLQNAADYLKSGGPHVRA